MENLRAPSSGSAPSANSAVASARIGSACPSLGFSRATRQTSTEATTPGVVSRGISPARASEDLPVPLAPTISRNGVPRSDAAARRRRASSMARARPKNTAACSASNGAKPRNGEPFSFGHERRGPSTPRVSSHCRSSCFQLGFEGVGAGKGVERRLELAALVPKPLAPECLERIELRLRLAAALGVGGRQRRVGGLAEHVDVRHAALLRPFERGEQLVGGARGIGPPVGHADKIGRQLGADAGPEDRQHDVAGDGFRNLRLEGAVGLVVVLFPQDRNEARDAVIVAVELGHDRFDPPALGRDVAGRRYE